MEKSRRHIDVGKKKAKKKQAGKPMSRPTEGQPSKQQNTKNRSKHRHHNRNRKPSGKSSNYGTTPKSVLKKNNLAVEDEYRKKALSRFKRQPPLTGIPSDLPEINTFEFQFKLQPVSLKEEERVANFVVKKGEWGWIEGERFETIQTFTESSTMTLEQALSLRSAILQQKSVYSHRTMKYKARKMLSEYKNGTSVVDLSKKYDFPPMNIFRALLEEKGWSKTKIRDTLREPSKFSERERKEFEEAEQADNVTSVDQSERHQEADRFEDKIADWFEAQGVRLRRQPELVAEQEKEFGRPINTPDLLFIDHVFINGEPVAWIDAKHFYGADVKFQIQKTKKQMARYCNEWGSGAIMFRHGFSNNLYIPGVLMLDASILMNQGYESE